jgi:membrane protein DedA with SNARE-associated domain
MRTAAFFTAGALKLKVYRFLIIDGIGISLVTPLFVWLGFHFGKHIDEVVRRIHQAEQWVLWNSLSGVVVVGGAWFWRRHRRRVLREREVAATETYVQPTVSEEVGDGPPRGEQPRSGA